MSAPRISIVIPRTAEMPEPGETVRSIEAQGYPDLEVLAETGSDFGDALDRGFARATGEVRAFVPAGDLLLPGALEGVAAAVSHARKVVMGGGLFRVEGMEDSLVAQPAEYAGFADHLRIWERGFDAMAYASLFWHRSVQGDIGRLGGLGAPAVTAYGLSCRIGSVHAIHKVDEDWSVASVAPVSGQRTEAQDLAECIEVSRTFWGGWWSATRWTCEASWRRYATARHEHARHHARRAEAARAAGDRAGFLREYLLTWWSSSRLARERLRRPGPDGGVS